MNWYTMLAQCHRSRVNRPSCARVRCCVWESKIQKVTIFSLIARSNLGRKALQEARSAYRLHWKGDDNPASAVAPIAGRLTKRPAPAIQSCLRRSHPAKARCNYICLALTGSAQPLPEGLARSPGRSTTRQPYRKPRCLIDSTRFGFIPLASDPSSQALWIAPATVPGWRDAKRFPLAIL